MVQRLPKPPFLQQPFGSHKCWAYALSSWLQVSKDRQPNSPEAIIKACSNYIDSESGLKTKFVSNVLESPFIRMGWKVIDGADFTMDELKDLISVGYVYAIVQPKPVSVGTFSHARVLYAYSPPEAEYPAAGYIDPILGDDAWNFNAISTCKLILGMAQELLSSDATDGSAVKDADGNITKPSRTPWNVIDGKSEVFRWTPRPV